MTMKLNMSLAAICLFSACASAEESELDKRLAALRAAGEPMTAEVIQNPTVDPSENAAADIEAAAAQIKNDSAEYNALDNRDETVRLPLTDFEIEKLLQISKQNEEALKLLADAAKKPKNVAQIKIATPAFNTHLPGLNGARANANLLSYEAYNQFGQGNYDVALDRLEQMKPISEYASSHGALVGILVGVGIDAMECKRLADMAPALEIGGEAHQVTRDRIETLIQDLMDQSDCQKNLVRSVRFERFSSIDSLRLAMDEKLTPAQAAELEQVTKISPAKTAEQKAMIENNLIHLLDFYDEYFKCITASDYIAVKKAMDQSTVMATLRNSKNKRDYVFANIIIPSLERIPLSTFEHMTTREATAAALAMKLYRMDHQDQLPQKLEDLVPKYLSRLPRDYHADNKPLNYRGGDNPIIWSVGRDGIDNGGVSDPKTRSKGDIVTHLINLPRNESGN